MRPLLPLLLLVLAACAPGEGPKGDDSASTIDDDSDDSALGPVDDDGDGFPPPEDCDDANPSVHPSADETCNGLDDDCDGVIDEPDAVDAPTWYADSDGDGYGDPAIAAVACDPPADHVADPTDCDDANASLHPGAAEICRDGVDQDCDGVDADDCILDPRVPGVLRFAGEESGDHAGESLSAAGDVNGDGFADILVGDYEYDEGLDDAGAAYLLYGPVTESRGLSLADARFLGEVFDDYAGYPVSGPGDVNGDGFDDILVGAAGNAEADHDAGAVYLVYGGPLAADRDLSLADAKLMGEDKNAYAGCDLSGAGDVDGDGLADILVGAYGDDDGGTKAGAAYLLYGPVTGDLSLSLADAKLVGDADYSEAGRGVSGAGDVNGDGFADILVGAPHAGGSGKGTVHLFYGPVTADHPLSLADATLIGEHEGGNAGSSLSDAGDVNGDGLADILVGTEEAKVVFLVYGPLTGDLDLSLANARLLAEESDDAVGHGLSGAGDLDGDGFADILIGGWGYSAGRTRGGAYLLYGPVTGDLDLSLADTRFVGEERDDYAGAAVSGAGDLDGDGFADILGGVPFADDFAGAAYLILATAMP